MKSKSVLFVFVLVCLTSPLLADEGHHHLGPDEKVGSVSFPTSCAPAVQKSFERGVALMHSFEYEMAENQFKEVAKQDPGCAMAYWGQALSLYHQLWSRPTKADLKRGNDLLTHAAALKPKTAREREYINALAVFIMTLTPSITVSGPISIPLPWRRSIAIIPKTAKLRCFTRCHC
jgi:hypothetical protein